MEVLAYVDQESKCPVGSWMDELKDPLARQKIFLRLDRLKRGVLGIIDFCEMVFMN